MLLNAPLKDRCSSVSPSCSAQKAQAQLPGRRRLRGASVKMCLASWCQLPFGVMFSACRAAGCRSSPSTW
eukprot:8711142-Pyramimonas_sp.AAC.1